MVARSRLRWCSKGAWPVWWSQISVTAQPKECASEGSDEDRGAPEVFPAPRRIAAGGDQESVQKALHPPPPTPSFSAGVSPDGLLEEIPRG